jgi:hypothetical protein
MPRVVALRMTVIVAASVVLAAVVAVASGAGGASAAGQATDARRGQGTSMISTSIGGGRPNGASTHGVISGDRRYARVIAFQSRASNLVRGDRNGQEDVFAVSRQPGYYDNTGQPWVGGRARLVSRTPTGAGANGPSFAPAVSGGLYSPPRCLAFLSAASNLVHGDTNHKVDAFVSWGHAGLPHRLLLPRKRQSRADATAVAVSADCSRIAFVAGGELYVRVHGQTKRIRVAGAATDPSFSTGVGNDLVFAASGGVYLARNATAAPRLIAPGGSDPAYNDIKRRVVAYEVTQAGTTQIAYKELGHAPRIVSSRHDVLGDGPSRDPVIGNSGYYITFETDARNLTTSASGYAADFNHYPDVYLYTGVRDITLIESIMGLGRNIMTGQHPSMSFYANYILFDSGAQPNSRDLAEPQVYMRYLGSITAGRAPGPRRR